MAWFTCKVNNVGPASDGTETPDPTIYINLTDTAGSFSGQWFFAANNSKSQMMAVALSAITLQATVQVAAPAPNAANNPFTEISRLYLNAP
jgi:hypothetical protein